jgi:hypothetical protein
LRPVSRETAENAHLEKAAETHAQAGRTHKLNGTPRPVFLNLLKYPPVDPSAGATKDPSLRQKLMRRSASGF